MTATTAFRSDTQATLWPILVDLMLHACCHTYLLLLQWLASCLSAPPISVPNLAQWQAPGPSAPPISVPNLAQWRAVILTYCCCITEFLPGLMTCHACPWPCLMSGLVRGSCSEISGLMEVPLQHWFTYVSPLGFFMYGCALVLYLWMGRDMILHHCEVTVLHCLPESAAAFACFVSY